MFEREEREAVDDDAEQAQDDGSLNRAPDQLRAGHAPRQPAFDREHDRYAHDEDERGKYEVGRGQAIPGGVVHEAPRTASAVVVDHDHERDRDPARDVQRQQALGRVGRE